MNFHLYDALSHAVFSRLQCMWISHLNDGLTHTSERDLRYGVLRRGTVIVTMMELGSTFVAFSKPIGKDIYTNRQVLSRH